MENMCINCGFYKTPPLFWGGSTEPLFCDCTKERSYSEEDMLQSFLAGIKCESKYGKNFEQFIKQFKKK